MRKIVEGLVLTTGQTATTTDLYPGARNEGWRLWDGIIRVANTGADTATVGLYSSVTAELIDSATVAATAGKSSNLFKIPGQYYLVVDTVGAGGCTLDIYLDGDTGPSPENIAVV